MVVEDDIVKTSDDTKIIGSSFDLSLSFSDSLYLHHNDTCGSPIVAIKLTGTENYKMWSIVMKFALRNHNKLGFIDGTCKRDDKNVALANKLGMCNSVVVTWILSSLSSKLFNGAIYAKTSYEMWNDLKKTYDKVDGSDKQFDAMISLPPCACEAATHFEKHNQLIKLMQFLIVLDDSYFAIRSNILTREPLPSVVVKNLIGMLHLYPAGYVKRNFNANTRHVPSNNASADVHFNNDLKANRNVRIGKQFNGLYLFDVDNACKIVSNNCIASCFVSKTLWHQRLGHPTDQVLNALKTTINLDSHSTSDHLCDTSEICSGALLHNTTAQDTGERSLNVI
nr:hypothetical protein [Tanacetum cinerariifolium]